MHFGWDMDLREAKGLEIAAKCRIGRDGDTWLVPSQSKQRGRYKVRLGGGAESCTCDDFDLSGQPCKHIHAVRIVAQRERDGETDPIAVVPVPKRPTYKQDWPLYDEAQRTEKHRFQVLLHDLCQGIEEPPTAKTGRRPHSVRDAVFAMTMKVYTGFSGRRFQCDLVDAHGNGYTSKAIPGLKVCHFLEDASFTPILKALIVQSALPLRLVETTFAPDSTGFSVSRYIRWYDEKWGKECSGKDWCKVHVMVGVNTHIVTACEIHGRDAADCPLFQPMLDTTAQNFTVKEVCADKAYLSHESLEAVAALGGFPLIPFKSNSSGVSGGLWAQLYGYFMYNREDFLKHYHQRSNVESVMSMVKAKFGASLRSKTETAMRNEAYCKILAHNICVVHQSQIELGIEGVFWKDEPTEKGRDVLPFVRPNVS